MVIADEWLAYIDYIVNIAMITDESLVYFHGIIALLSENLYHEQITLDMMQYEFELLRQ
jgi:hypothetical protein